MTRSFLLPMVHTGTRKILGCYVMPFAAGVIHLITPFSSTNANTAVHKAANFTASGLHLHHYCRMEKCLWAMNLSYSGIHKATILPATVQNSL